MSNCDFGEPCRCALCREKRKTIKHFGVSLKYKESGLRLTRDNYIDIRPRDIKMERESLSRHIEWVDRLKSSEDPKNLESYMKYYSEMSLLEDMEDRMGLRMHYAMNNYDLCMRYFESLEAEQFNKELEAYTKAEGLLEITDLNSVAGVSGYYLMVLEKYKQVYVGRSKDICQRVRAHWSAQLPLTTLNDGKIDEVNVLAIDTFKALDTTRIFVIELPRSSVVDAEYEPYFIWGEYDLINKVPFDYCLNRDVGLVNLYYKYNGHPFEWRMKVATRFSNRLGIPKSLEFYELKESEERWNRLKLIKT